MSNESRPSLPNPVTEADFQAVEAARNATINQDAHGFRGADGKFISHDAVAETQAVAELPNWRETFDDPILARDRRNALNEREATPEQPPVEVDPLDALTAGMHSGDLKDLASKLEVGRLPLDLQVKRDWSMSAADHEKKQAQVVQDALDKIHAQAIKTQRAEEAAEAKRRAEQAHTDMVDGLKTVRAAREVDKFIENKEAAAARGAEYRERREARQEVVAAERRAREAAAVARKEAREAKAAAKKQAWQDRMGVGDAKPHTVSAEVEDTTSGYDPSLPEYSGMTYNDYLGLNSHQKRALETSVAKRKQQEAQRDLSLDMEYAAFDEDMYPGLAGIRQRQLNARLRAFAEQDDAEEQERDDIPVPPVLQQGEVVEPVGEGEVPATPEEAQARARTIREWAGDTFQKLRGRKNKQEKGSHSKLARAAAGMVIGATLVAGALFLTHNDGGPETQVVPVTTTTTVEAPTTTTTMVPSPNPVTTTSTTEAPSNPMDQIDTQAEKDDFADMVAYGDQLKETIPGLGSHEQDVLVRQALHRAALAEQEAQQAADAEDA